MVNRDPQNTRLAEMQSEIQVHITGLDCSLSLLAHFGVFELPKDTAKHPVENSKILLAYLT